MWRRRKFYRYTYMYVRGQECAPLSGSCQGHWRHVVYTCNPTEHQITTMPTQLHVHIRVVSSDVIISLQVTHVWRRRIKYYSHAYVRGRKCATLKWIRPGSLEAYGVHKLSNLASDYHQAHAVSTDQGSFGRDGGKGLFAAPRSYIHSVHEQSHT